jgi:3-hydroxyisobutyrate dehydrogenase-like beta-hydroxyacid dehydrogenase
MGSVFIERFVAAGRRTLAYDPSPSAMAQAQALGAEPYPSAGALAQAADIVDVMVRTDAQMLECVLGPGGVFDGLAPGKALVLHSTVHPRTTRTIADAARAKGVAIADACIGGQPPVLRAGRASVIVGGDPAVADRLRSHLALLGTVYYVGPLSSGNTTKMLHNLVVGAHRLVISEALQIGLAAGVPAASLLAVLRHDRAVWDQPEDAFDYGPGLTFNRNLVEQILPPIEQLTEELGSDVPITQLLIGLAKRSGPPPPSTAS